MKNILSDNFQGLVNRLASTLIIVTLAVFIYQCSGLVEEDRSSLKDQSIEEFFESFHHKKLELNPLEATKAGEYEYNDRLANYISDEYQEEQLKFYIEYRNRIKDFESENLVNSQRLSLQIMKWECDIKTEGLQNQLVSIASPMYDLPSFELLPVYQMSSLHLYISQLAGGQSIQPFDTPEQYDDWLKRVDDFLVFLDTAMMKMREGIEKKVVWPKAIIERSIRQLEPLIATAVEEHVYYGPIRLLPDSFSGEERDRLSNAYRSMITDKLIPQFAELRDFLQGEYLPYGRESSGISDLPGGKEAYDHMIKYHTTTEMTANDIHELGKMEVTRIAGEMEQVKDEIGFQGSLKEFFDHVRSAEEQMSFTDAQQVIDNFNAIHDRMKPYLDNLFDLKPKGRFVVRRTEAFREQSAAAEYVPGTKDGSRPGTFYVPIPDVTKYNKFADEALFLHEAIPGHHYQLSLQQENEELPAFLHAEGNGVFVEGWALYAESLGEELGLYTDPYQRFGMLSMEMHRAIRLVVDTGIHAKGWTREKAIQYSLDNEAESEQAITAEIERYMAMPGQALSYKIGQLKIRELRDRAEQALGERFNIKEFHNQVLNSGSLPMQLLEKKIDDWIERMMP